MEVAGARLFVRCGAVALAVLSLACTTVGDSGGSVSHYLGYVRVISPARLTHGAPIDVADVSTVGVWVDGGGPGVPTPVGAGVGFRRLRRERIPLDCRVVFRVTTEEQIDHLLERLRASGASGDGICAVQDSSSQ